MLFAALLRPLIKSGRFVIVDANDRRHELGDGKDHQDYSGVTIKLHNPALHWRLALEPRLRVPEAYVDGELTIEEGTLKDFIWMMGDNMRQVDGSTWGAVTRWYWNARTVLAHYNPIGRAQANVKHHYDLSGELYDLFLDKDRQYSCAYFRSENDSLEIAQENKKRHIGRKLLIEPGMRVLDIGSGWGGLGLFLAREYDCEVTGVTLSKEQHAMSVRRAEEAGLSDRVQFHLRDYREIDDRFDRVVSVGMFEHVGAWHFREYFRKVRELLTDEGVALIHTIGRMSPPQPTSPFIRRYIFPGGYLPCLSQFSTRIEESNLWLTDLEILRSHYADTLKHWHSRFQDNRDKVRELYDERFCRMWELYLLGCEMSFRLQELCVFQAQLSRMKHTVPQTRDYLYA